jgi:hypothetical protein
MLFIRFTLFILFTSGRFFSPRVGAGERNETPPGARLSYFDGNAPAHPLE